MRGSTDTSREGLNREQEGRAVWSSVEEELGQGKEYCASSGANFSGHPSPEGVEDGDGDGAPELLGNSTNSVREEDSSIESGQIAGCADDNVAYGDVPERLVRISALAEADEVQDDGTIEVDSIERYKLQVSWLSQTYGYSYTNRYLPMSNKNQEAQTPKRAAAWRGWPK
jgi:hypothetical protein